MKIAVTSSSNPSVSELLMLLSVSFFLGDMTRLILAVDGLCSDCLEVRRINEDPRRKGVALGAVGLGGSKVSTIDVLTMGVGIEDVFDIGRMTTSFPSKVSAESREFSSVSGLTASVLTTTGKRTVSKSLM